MRRDEGRRELSGEGSTLLSVYGESLIDLIEGEEGSFTAHPGGSPYNLARAAARQLSPEQVAYLCPFSHDRFGVQLRQLARTDGVSCLAPAVAVPSSLAVVQTSGEGAARYQLYREGIADRASSASDLLQRLPERSFIFHSGSLALTPRELNVTHQLVKTMRSRGALISLDLNLRLGATSDHDQYRAGIYAVLPTCDILKVSDEDLSALGLTEAPEQAVERLRAETKWLAGTPPLILLTLGAEGAILFSPSGEAIRRPAAPLRRVGDTVGAGDTFYGVFLATLIRSWLSTFPSQRSDQLSLESRLSGLSLTECLQRALVGASLNVESEGCQPPSWTELESRLTEGNATVDE